MRNDEKYEFNIETFLQQPFKVRRLLFPNYCYNHGPIFVITIVLIFTIIVHYDCKINVIGSYLTHLCTPSLSARSTRHLSSAEQALLHVPFAHTSTMQSRAFSVVGRLGMEWSPIRSLVLSQSILP